MFIAALFTIANLEPTQMPISNRLDKANVGHIHRGILVSHKQNKIRFLVAMWIQLEAVILRELMQKQKTKNCMCSLTSES